MCLARNLNGSDPGRGSFAPGGHITAVPIKFPTRSVRCSTRGSSRWTRGACVSTRGSHHTTRGLRHWTPGSKDATRAVRSSTRGSRGSTRGARYPTRGSGSPTPGSRSSTRPLSSSRAGSKDATRGSKISRGLSGAVRSPGCVARRAPEVMEMSPYGASPYGARSLAAVSRCRSASTTRKLSSFSRPARQARPTSARAR